VITVSLVIIYVALLVGFTHCAYRVEQIFNRKPAETTPRPVPALMPTTPKVPVVLTKQSDPARTYAAK
jgi:hypothetical protein